LEKVKDRIIEHLAVYKLLYANYERQQQQINELTNQQVDKSPKQITDKSPNHQINKSTNSFKSPILCLVGPPGVARLLWQIYCKGFRQKIYQNVTWWY